MSTLPSRDFILGRPYTRFDLPEKVDFVVIEEALSFHLPNLTINTILKPLKKQFKIDRGTRYICAIISHILTLVNWKDLPKTTLEYILQPLLRFSSVSSPSIEHDKIWQIFALEVALSAHLVKFEFSLEQSSQNKDDSDLDLFIYPKDSSPVSYLPTSNIILPSGIQLNGIAYQFKSVMSRKKIAKKIIQASKQLKPYRGGIVGIDISTIISKKSIQNNENIIHEFKQIVVEIEEEMSNPKKGLHKNTASVAGIDICCRFFEENKVVVLRWIIWNINYKLGFGLTAKYQTIGNFYESILKHPFAGD